jgi:hypothetical protein
MALARDSNSAATTLPDTSVRRSTRMLSQRAPEAGHSAGDFSIGHAACPNEARHEPRADHCPSHLAAQHSVIWVQMKSILLKSRASKSRASVERLRVPWTALRVSDTAAGLEPIRKEKSPQDAHCDPSNDQHALANDMGNCAAPKRECQLAQ